MAVGRLPESGEVLCSQPTISRLENLPSATALKRMMAAMIELFCDSFEQVPRRILLDIDDTEDRVHGGQQLALFNAHYDSRCFLPIHIYEATTGKPVAVILRPGKTPDGTEVALVLRHVIGRIRARWPAVEIVVRGDSHYGRPKAMAWCERQRSATSSASLVTRCCCARSARSPRTPPGSSRRRGEGPPLWRFPLCRQSWNVERRVIARVEAGPQGADSRFIVTNLRGLPKTLYEKVYCARGQAENLIKAHKLHLASDRTSCTKATANQFRLLIHTAAYWLMLSLRGLAPRPLLARCPVRYDPPLPDQGRRARHRDGHPHQDRPAERLPLSGRLRRSCRPHRQAAAVSDGAVAPYKPFGPTSNPDQRAPDATENRARSPPSCAAASPS